MAASAEWSDVTTDLAAKARDAAYVAVGLGVLGFQRMQVQRHNLVQRLGADFDPGGAGSGAGQEHLDAAAADLRRAVAAGVRQADRWIEEMLAVLGANLQPVEEQLPQSVRDLVVKGRKLGERLNHLVSAFS